MGVNIHVYAVYGIRIDNYDMEFSEAEDEVYETCPLNILMDGMNGQYMVFGKILFDSGNIRYGMENGDDYTVVDQESLAEIEKEYKLEFAKWFPKFSYYMDPPFQLMMLTHYS